VYNQVRNRINTSFNDMGEQQLKHVSEPVRVYAIPRSRQNPKITG
jgi:hypothetical protein